MRLDPASLPAPLILDQIGDRLAFTGYARITRYSETGPTGTISDSIRGVRLWERAPNGDG